MHVLVRAQRGWSAAVEPGEWLLTCTGIVLALDIVIRWLPRNFPLPPDAIMAAGICIVLVIPTLSRRLSPPWKRFFILLVLVYALPMVVILVEHLGRWPLPEPRPAQVLEFWQRFRRIMVLIAVSCVLVSEYRAGRHGSWWHAFGVASVTLFWAIA